jgi:hypothetical protein
MSTTVLDLVQRVRSNINESPATIDPQRTDDEIARWLQESQLDYISKIPADAVPELIEEVVSGDSSWTRAADFVKLLSVQVSHTISGTSTITEPATILSIDDDYQVQYYPFLLGAWAQFRKDVIAFGPNAYLAYIRYQRAPADISDVCATFEMDAEHEEPIVNRATAKALSKINDADAERYMTLYNDRVAAEAGPKYYQPLRVEKTAARNER